MIEIIVGDEDDVGIARFPLEDLAPGIDVDDSTIVGFDTDAIVVEPLERDP